MIDVPELDLYLKAFYYVFNFQSEVFNTFTFSEEIQRWISFLFNNSGMLGNFEKIVERNDFGFSFELGLVNSMYGTREVRGLRDPALILPAPFLKVYPRLLYANDLIAMPANFESYSYYFRYFPKMIVGIYRRRPDNDETELSPTEYWIKGTHTNIRELNENRISYNVAVEVDLHTIIEEELHAQQNGIHGTDAVDQILQRITDEMPDLKSEIEANLNRILSTEEKRFFDVGEVLKVENASELRILEDFITKFETEVIQQSETNFYELTVQARQTQQSNETVEPE